jgi:hypothetical protein
LRWTQKGKTKTIILQRYGQAHLSPKIPGAV